VELNEIKRKYKAAQLSVDQITLQDQTAQLMTLEQEKASLKEQVSFLSFLIILKSFPLNVMLFKRLPN
jgi:hypothetical protein